MRWGSSRRWKRIEASETKSGVVVAKRAARPSLIFVLWLVTMIACGMSILHSVGLDLPSLVLLVGVWTSIAASQTDVNSPLNQTLFDAIRGNLDFLYATQSTILFNQGGIGYNDGTTAFDRYSWYGSRNTNPGDDTNLFSHPNEVAAGQPRIYIPEGVTTLGVTISGACSTGTLSAVGIDVIINGQAASFRSLPIVANAAWQTEVEIDPGVTGWVAVDINAHNTTGSTQNNRIVYCYGLIIRSVE